jgi:hypothetical protein
MGKKTNWCTKGLVNNPRNKGLKVFQNFRRLHQKRQVSIEILVGKEGME